MKFLDFIAEHIAVIAAILATAVTFFALGWNWVRLSSPGRSKLAVQLTLILVVLGLGAAGARWFVTHGIEAERAPDKEKRVLVEVIEATPSNQRVHVQAMGTVIPAVQIELQPQVSGLVIAQHPQLLPGAHVAADEVLVEIDPRDYQYIVEQRKADVERAAFELKVEQGRQTVAKEEWELLGSEVPVSETGRELALRKPHIENAQAALRAAKSALEKAELDLRRTKIEAPFNALVLEESVDIGQTVSPQSKLVTLVGTDAFHVQVSVPVEKLPWVRVPGVNATEGSVARIVQETGNGRQIELPGRVVKLQGDITPAGRMARVLAQIDDPLRLAGANSTAPEDHGLPLLLGAYVRVAIEGPELAGVFELPREAIREGNRLWIMDSNDQLDIRPIEIVWTREHTVLVKDSLRAGDRIVTSRIGTPLPGLKLRTEDVDENEAPEEPQETD